MDSDHQAPELTQSNENPTNIECLPTEIIFIIFTHLTPSVRRVASRCCKRFLEIWLCDDFADDRRLVFDYRCVLDPEQEPLSTLLKSSRNYRTLVFGFVNMRGASIFAGQFAENVTTIELKDIPKWVNKQSLLSISTKKVSILSQFPNLQTIKVDNYVDLNILRSKYLDTTSDTFRVEIDFEINFKDIFSFAVSQRNKIQKIHLFLDCRHKTMGLQMPRFVNLKYFVFSGYETNFIPDNLEEQCPALKDLTITIHHRLPHTNWTCLKTLEACYIPKEEMSRISIFRNLKKLTLRTHDVYCFFVHETFLNQNLKTLNILCTFSSKNICLTCFHKMTKSFPNLENLTCYFRVTNDYLEELANNTPKLKYLTLYDVDPSVSFECLPNLTTLENVILE